MAWITNVSKIIFGASNKDAIKHGFKEINITDKELNQRSGNKIKIESGFLRDECLELFK
jgi:guanine deaminase